MVGQTVLVEVGVKTAVTVEVNVGVGVWGQPIEGTPKQRNEQAIQKLKHRAMRKGSGERAFKGNLILSFQTGLRLKHKTIIKFNAYTNIRQTYTQLISLRPFGSLFGRTFPD